MPVQKSSFFANLLKVSMLKTFWLSKNTPSTQPYFFSRLMFTLSQTSNRNVMHKLFPLNPWYLTFRQFLLWKYSCFCSLIMFSVFYRSCVLFSTFYLQHQLKRGMIFGLFHSHGTDPFSIQFLINISSALLSVFTWSLSTQGEISSGT